MKNPKALLTDSHGRAHQYLRISLTERCNLRCSYCMPLEGVQLSPRSHLMSDQEIFTIAQHFVRHGITKIRLTGGEPLVRKDFDGILKKLATLPVTLSLTTNAVNVDRYIPLFQAVGMQSINVSLDTLDAERFKQITHRDYFNRVYKNMQLLLKAGLKVKVNVVLMKGVNDDEILDFIRLSEAFPYTIRFIEFMPFDGNRWNLDKMVASEKIMETIYSHYDKNQVVRIQDAPNDTSKNYKIKGAAGQFAVITTVTNPFCDSCNRLRLTANGQLKNCLFSQTENDLLTALRAGKSISPAIKKAVLGKLAVRGGMDALEKLQNPDLHGNNRSMITIGG